MKASDERYGGQARPKITQADIEGGEAVVVTISDVEEEKVKGDDGDKILLVLLTEEYGDKVHRLNKTQRDYLIEQLGDETDEWIGKKVPLVKTRQEFGTPGRKGYKEFDTVWVAAPDEWKAIFKAWESGGSAKRTRRGKK